MTVEYWLNEDGDYWVDAEATPDPIEAASIIWETASYDNDREGDGQLWLVGRGKRWLKDCAVDHQCDEDEECRCDTHVDEPCTPQHEVDAWHFASYPVEGARHITDSDIYHTA